jgi:hypothetical protein
VVRGHARDKAGGKTRSADKTISIDRTTLAVLRRWRERQNGERELHGAAYHPGDYVFTFEDGRPPIRTPSDSGSTAWQQLLGYHGSHFMIYGTLTRPTRSKPGSARKSSASGSDTPSWDSFLRHMPTSLRTTTSTPPSRQRRS